MTIYANLNVTRTNVYGILLANVPAQIDEASEMMGAYYNSSHPYDVFEVYIRYTVFAFRRDDLLTDVANLDPLTGTYALYRVVGNPAPYPDGHCELKVNRFEGAQS